LPFLGTVAASWPSPAEEELLDIMSFDEWLDVKREGNFMVKVSSDALTGAGIHRGDITIVERGRKVAPGDIVIAEVDDDWVMRRYETRNGKPILLPANKAYQPIEPVERLSLIGVVTAVIRKYK
jgi:DNA polymerase V